VILEGSDLGQRSSQEIPRLLTRFGQIRGRFRHIPDDRYPGLGSIGDRAVSGLSFGLSDVSRLGPPAGGRHEVRLGAPSTFREFRGGVRRAQLES
jgi:hypothetical protein